MITFDKYSTLELLRLVLSTTLDEKLMVRTWRLFRSGHRGPLFPVTCHQPVAQAHLNGLLVEHLRECGMSAADICRVLGLHRSTVGKHLMRFAALTLDQADERRYERQRLLEHAENAVLMRQIERQQELIMAQCSRPRL